MNKYPRHATDLAPFDSAIEKFVLPGLLPSQPILLPTSRVCTLGSCFAKNVAIALQAAGRNARHIGFPEWANSPLANATVFAHILDPARPYDLPEHAQLITRDVSESAAKDLKDDLFILTLGVAPCIYPLNSLHPSYVIDSARAGGYEMRHTGVEENIRAIDFVVSALRQLNPKISIVLTVSPVPLNRTFNLGSAVRVDAISKATLLLAATQFMETKPRDVYYWPSYEIVRWVAPHIAPAFGTDDGLLRHVNRDLVDIIVRLFLKYYMVPEAV